MKNSEDGMSLIFIILYDVPALMVSFHRRHRVLGRQDRGTSSGFPTHEGDGPFCTLTDASKRKCSSSVRSTPGCSLSMRASFQSLRRLSREYVMICNMSMSGSVLISHS